LQCREFRRTGGSVAGFGTARRLVVLPKLDLGRLPGGRTVCRSGAGGGNRGWADGGAGAVQPGAAVCRSVGAVSRGKRVRRTGLSVCRAERGAGRGGAGGGV